MRTLILLVAASGVVVAALLSAGPAAASAPEGNGLEKAPNTTGISDALCVVDQ